MRLQVDLHQPITQPAASLAPTTLRIIGVPVSDPRSFAEPAAYRYSYMSECECPSDCPRDHGNE